MRRILVVEGDSIGIGVEMGDLVAAGGVVQAHPFALVGRFVEDGEHPVFADLVNPLELELRPFVALGDLCFRLRLVFGIKIGGHEGRIFMQVAGVLAKRNARSHQ